MQGPYSLNGYRVRVYRQDSATQWFTGIITHHDLFTRTMIVMNDQVLEPQNVDPSMVQMTFLDDVVHSLLKGENIGITSRRRSRASQNSNTVHGHYTRAQANSPRPAMNSQAAVPKQNTHQQQQQRNIRSNRRKGSDSSIPDEEKMKEEKYDYIGRGENPKGKNKQLMNKRRKPEEDEKKLNMKRLRTDNISDFSENSDSENSNKRIINNPLEQKPENELKNKNTSKVNGEEEKYQNNEKAGEETLMDSQPPWDQVQEDKKHEETEKQKFVDSQLQEKIIIQSSEQATLSDHNSNDLLLQENMEKTRTMELLPKEQFTSRPPTPKCVIDITNDTNSEKVAQENSNTFGLQTLQKMDSNVSDSKHSIANAKYLETAKQDSDQSWVKDVVKVDLTQSNVKNAPSGNDHLIMEKEKNQYVSYASSLSSVSVMEDKLRKRSPPPEIIKSKLNASVDAHKTKSSPLPEVAKSKTTHSPDSLKSKATYVNSHAAGERRLVNKIEHELSRCSFHPVPSRGSTLDTTKSPLIIDKNEHFTVYRDPALIGSETGANHISPFLNQHPFPLHSSSHRTCLNPSTHHPALTPAPHLLAGSSSQTPLPTINTHPLTSAPHHSVHHPHLLPAVLPGVPTASLLGGHPRLETAHASSLSHLALAHQQQQQLLQHQSPHLLGQAHPSASYSQLGLYPIIWQYPNGTHAYSGLGLPSSKWVHPENAVNAESSLRRNSPSSWLHQPTPVTSADSIGLLSHIPVRPSSAEPHRPLKITTHSSPPLTKSLVDHHKEELERKAFIEPLRSIASTSAKNDLDLNRVQTGKDGHLHRHFVDPLMNPLQRPPQETGERLNKYKEEHRRILQESIDVAPFTTKIKGLEGERDNYSRVASSSSSPKSHVIKQDKDMECSVSDLYKMKHSVPQSLPQSNYFTTLSNSVVNEPPRSYPSKEISNIYTEKQNNTLVAAANPQTLTSFISSLSKPPPLIKHQLESEGLVGKTPEHLPHQIASHSVTTFRNDCRSPTHLTISSTNTLRSMPALHRAPVFHPPIHHSLERKESSYSSLSPPTLTPVMPVNAGGKVQESQKPPTLIPEPKESQANFKSSSEQSLTEMWKSNNLGKEKGEWLVEKSTGKSQAAMASVIVRPPSSIKLDSVPVMQLVSKDRVSERSSTETNQTDCLKPAEAGEIGRIILPSVNSDSTHIKSAKNFQAVSQGDVPSSAVSAVSAMCNTKLDMFTSASTTSSASGWGGSEVTYSLSNTILPSKSLECTSSKSVSHSVTQTQECRVSTTAPVTPASSKTVSAVQPSSGFSGTTDFIHLKKHKAALAAAQYKSSNVSESDPNAVKNPSSSASLLLDGNVVCSTINKANSVGNGQASQTSQPNYHTKLKKAWLTRHSEEDKNTNKMENSGSSVSEIIKPCSVNLIASTSNDIQNSVDSKIVVDKYVKDDKVNRRKAKRTYESGSESGDSDESESKSEQRTKRQPKPTYKKKQNDLQKRKGDMDEDLKPNGVLSRSAKEKSKLKLQSNSNSAGIPRSVLKDWRKVKKLKQTGESFLQDDSCCEIGPNLQKCRECRLIRSKKEEEPTHSPVFCRFYYFRRLSFSKNGVVRIDGFSSPDQYDDEAMSLWTHENYEDDELDIETSKYILDIIGDKFCQLVTSEKTALSWVKKDAKIAWKRAVRGVREMCDACEATLFNIHWVCQKCGFVVCLDCYKAKERKSSRDKELYAWIKCVKGQPHDHKHLMPTQIIPSSVLTDLLDVMHTLREKCGIKSHCHCSNKQNLQVGTLPTMNGVSQVLQNVLNHSNKISLCMPESQQQNTPQKSEGNGNGSPGSDVSSDSKSQTATPPESQSPLHWLADLAEQKSREEKKENKEFDLEKQIKEEREEENPDSPNSRMSPPVSQNNEQGSTLRDLLTTTAGKLRVGSTDAGIAFAPVYSMGTPSGKSGRTMPNILDDIIASVVENKIPPNKAPKTSVKSELKEEPKESRKSGMDENKLYGDIPHSWVCENRILWLKDYKNTNNWKLFKECWKHGQPAVVSGVHKKMNMSLWKAESISLDFGDHQADLLNCKDSIISNANVKEFWDGFEEVSKRQKTKSGETVVLKLKDCPSGEEFKTMMPARYEDLLKSLPLPEYCNPEGKLNLASYLPGFFVRPDLGPRLCSAYGVAAAKDHDIGTTNLHVEVSDVVNILVHVGIAKGNGILSKAGILKKFEEEDLDDILRKRLKDSSEIPGALWHIYAGKDVDKIREFLQKISKEQGLEVLPEHDPIRDQSWYVTKKLRQRLFEECGVRTCTLVQFLGDAIILPAGTLHQVQNFHSCIQVTEDFVSPEHLVQSFHLTQELRLLKDEINYDDKLQVKNILYHAVKETVRALKIHEDETEDMEEN